MTRKMHIVVVATALLAVSLIGCSEGNESREDERGTGLGTRAEQLAEGEEKSSEQAPDRDADFETGVGLPTFNQISECFMRVAGMTLEEKKDGVIAIYGPRTGKQIGEILFGDDGDDYDMMLIVDKEAGDKEEGKAVYCLKNALASVLRIYNGYDIDDPFDIAWNIIEYGAQSPYVYGMEEYLVGNIDGGVSYAVKVVSNG